jgi:hypothetical protein
MNEEGPMKSIIEPGIRATGPLLHSMRAEVASLLERRQTSFPGAQPVSFAREHIEELKRQEYVVSSGDGDKRTKDCSLLVSLHGATRLNKKLT